MPSTALSRDHWFREAERIASSVVRANAETVDTLAEWPERGLHALLEAGLGGLVVPARHGGLDQGLSGLAQVCETLGRECASTAICFGIHCVGASVIAAQATPDQAERFLKPICEGRHITTLALSEPGTGAHFYFPQTRATAADAGTIALDGIKSFVTNGRCADSYVVSVWEEGGDDDGAMSCVIVPGDAEGMRWSDAWSGFGMRGNQSRTLELSGTRVPAENLLGRHGDQIWYAFNVVAPYFLVAMAGSYLGVARAALDCLTDHLRQREHSHNRNRLADVTVIQHRLGRLLGRLEAARALTMAAARQFDAGQPDAAALVMQSKAEVADAAVEIANEAMTMMGGIAYASGSRLQRALRDVRAAPVMAPTTDLLRIWVGRSALDLPLLTD